MKRLTFLAAAVLTCTAVTTLSGQSSPLLAEARRHVAAGRYAEAANTYRRCLEQSPSDTTVLGELATALDAAGRWPEAMPVLQRLVDMSAPDTKRLTKLAQYRAWSGSRQQAGALFERAYAIDSSYAVLLAAYGEYLTWTPRTRSRGSAMLRRALNELPNDAFTRERLANAELESGRYVHAARVAAPLAPSAQIRASLADSLVRATDVMLRVGARSETRSNQLNTDGLVIGTSLPLGYGRVSFDGEPLRVSDAAGSFEAVRGSIGFEYRNPSTPQLEAAVSGWSGLDTPSTVWEGRFVVRTPAASPVGLTAGADRGPIAETRRSLLGIDVGGMVRGAVHATSLRAGARLSLGAIESTVDGVSATINGENLDQNRRTAVSAMAMLTVHSHAPWMRMGYEFLSQRFDFNAFDDVTNVRHFGGYFSPQSDEVHLGVLQMSQRLGARLLLEVDARAGREAVQMEASRPRESRNAAVVYSHAAWRVAHTLDLDASYLYVNVFTAFRMQETRLALRRFF